MKTTLIAYIQNDLLTAPTSTLLAEDDLMAVGMLTSMQFMRLIQFVETQWHLSVPPEDMVLENFQSVAQICTYLSDRALPA